MSQSTSSSKLNTSQNGNKTRYISRRVNKTGRVDHETKKLTLSGKLKTNLKHACHLLIFFPAGRKSCSEL